MIQYEKIERFEPREVQSKTKTIFLPLTLLCPVELTSMAGVNWQLENDHLCDLVVNAEHKPVARELALRLHHLLEEDRNHPDAQGVIDQLMAMRAKPVDDFTAEETWEVGAFGLSQYCESSTAEIAMSRLAQYSGLVLEAFSGHDSYFKPDPSRQIIAVDGCKKSLLRYTHPDVERFCCDLNQVAEGEVLDFLSENSFDLVSVCFGYKYPRLVEPLMREFFRLLKPGGTISFVESRTHGYTQYTHRKFEGPNQLIGELVNSGFEATSATEIIVNTVRDMVPTEVQTGVFHVTGSKLC